jgi:tRNA threonylcarbamoyl adenosine modification protein YeaZ
MKILSLETSGKTFSVAVSDNGTVRAEMFFNNGNMHSETLLPAVKKLLKDLNFEITDIDKFAACSGPGSFTGIRIALTAAKSFAQSLNKPVVVIDALTLLAARLPEIKGIKIVSAIDALRDEVYVQSAKGIVIESVDKFIKKLSKHKNKILILGNAAIKHKQLFEKNLGKFSVSLNEDFHYPHASVLAVLANGKEGVAFSKVEPLYIRRSWAEEIK